MSSVSVVFLIIFGFLYNHSYIVVSKTDITCAQMAASRMPKPAPSSKALPSPSSPRLASPLVLPHSPHPVSNTSAVPPLELQQVGIKPQQVEGDVLSPEDKQLFLLATSTGSQHLLPTLSVRDEQVGVSPSSIVSRSLFLRELLKKNGCPFAN
jgi:hypothetical protein